MAIYEDENGQRFEIEGDNHSIQDLAYASQALGKQQSPNQPNMMQRASQVMAHGPLAIGEQVGRSPQMTEMNRITDIPGSRNRAILQGLFQNKPILPMVEQATQNPSSIPSLRSQFEPQQMQQFFQSNNPFIRAMRAGIPALEGVNQAMNIPDVTVDPKQMGLLAMGGKFLESPMAKQMGKGISEGMQGLKFRNPQTPAEAFGTMREKFAPAKQLVEDLKTAANEARATAGATQGGYIESQAESPVNLTRAQRLVDELPQKVKQAIFEDPKIERVGDMISPTLKNMERIRGHINDHIQTLDFTSKAPVQQAYADAGNIMTEGRPELTEGMKNYGETVSAKDQLMKRLQTSEGQTKTSPLRKMFSKEGGRSEDIDALFKLAEHEPRILDIAERIQKYGNQLQKEMFWKRVRKESLKWGTIGLIAGTPVAGLARKLWY